MMLPKTPIVVLLALTAAVAAQTGAWSSDPSAEPGDKSSCTGTCSTCPGKAKVMLGLAELKIAVLELTALSTAEQEEMVEAAIGKLRGVESCVAMSADHAVWVAYDASLTGVGQIAAAPEMLKLSPGRSYVLDPLPALAKGQERCVVYAIIPPGKTHDDSVAKALGGLPGLLAHRLDRMFNMLLVNYNAAKLEPEQIKRALLAMGYPAGLPGEELEQPRDAR